MNRAAVYIPEKLFFKIGEVCDITEVQAHVLRYWESEFPMLAPQKNRAGQRTYRKRDVEMVLRIKELLYEDQYTIAGAKKKLTGEIRGASKLKVVTPGMSEPSDATQQSPQPSGLMSSLSSSQSPTEAMPPMTPPRVNFDASVTTAREGTPLSEERRVAMHRLRQELRDLLTLLDADESPAGAGRK